MKTTCFKKIGLLVLFLVLALVTMFPVNAAAKKSGKWMKRDGGLCYIQKNGKIATGSCKINGTYYIFDESGKLIRPKKSRLVTVQKKIYYVNKKGRAVRGWFTQKNKLYYANKNGSVKRNTTYKGITLLKSGAAKKDTASKLKILTMQIIKEITTNKMTKDEKLRKCWNYMTGGSFRYMGKYPNFGKKGWQRETAYNMLTTHSGNCYSYACAFAALADEVGYKSYVICGRVPGNRDGSGDGYTRHAWVRINGCYYDPEAHYAGWARGIYGYGAYPMGHSVQSDVRFSS